MWPPRLRNDIETLVGVHTKEIDDLKKKYEESLGVRVSIERLSAQVAHIAGDIESVKKDLASHGTIGRKIVIVLVILWVSFFGIKKSMYLSDFFVPTCTKTESWIERC
jgi:hypothetical protein